MRSEPLKLREERAKAYERQESRKKSRIKSEDKNRDEAVKYLDFLETHGTMSEEVKATLPSIQSTKETNEEDLERVIRATETNVYGAYMRINRLLNWEGKEAELDFLTMKYLCDENGEISEEKLKDLEAVGKHSHAYRERILRIHNQVKFMMAFAKEDEQKKPIGVTFVTLTFTDEVLEKTTAETRRKYVGKFFAENSVVYIANVDFGDKNNREHYHGMAVGHFEKGSWKYGFSDFESIRPNMDDALKVSKYVAKLTAHATKESTKNKKIIFSRNRPQIQSYYDMDDEKGCPILEYKLNTESGRL